MSVLDVQSATAEASRLAAVRRYDVLDTPPDGAFDRITAIAANLFAVPISIISVVDHDRIWFKSHHGLDGVSQIGRSPGLCASAIMQTEPWILTDASRDVRALANPLVAGEFGLRFYVGVPLRTHDGFNLGTLCVIDRTPRPVTEQQIEHLTSLSSLVMDQLELQLSARRAVQRLELMARESDHRVMNSLQLVSSLLALQRREAGSSAASEQLQIAAARVTAIARVHQHIHQSEVMDTIDCAAYLRRLGSDLSAMLGLDDGGIVVDGSVCTMPSQRVVPLGLIVNELVTNAVKHGAGRIVVVLQGDAGGCALSVSDDGTGLPVDFDPSVASGLGMKVVSALVQRLGGALSWGAGDAGGARFMITLPSEQA